MAEALPENSLIVKETFCDHEVITIPEIPRMGMSLLFPFGLLFMSAALLWLIFIQIQFVLTSPNQIALNTDLMFVFAIYLFQFAVLACCLYFVYLNLRKPYPQKIVLKDDFLYFDSGAAPIIHDGNSMKTLGDLYTGGLPYLFWRRIKTARRKHYKFSLRQVSTLTMRGPHKKIRLEIDDGLKRVELADTVPEAEKAWLVRHIKQYYGLFAQEAAETRNKDVRQIIPESRIQQNIQAVNEVLTIPARKRSLIVTLLFLPFLIFLFTVWLSSITIIFFKISDLDPGALTFLLIFMVPWSFFGAYTGSFIYLLCRKKVPQVLTLKPQTLNFDSGASPPAIRMTYGELWQEFRFARRKQYVFSLEQIATLRLSALYYRSCLAINDGSKFVPLAQALTNVEREWLLKHIKDYYQQSRDIE